jgi:CcmD family protein
MNAVMVTAVLQTASDIANQFNSYLVLGYFVMWLIVVVYITTLIVRQRNLKQDLQLMQQILQDYEKNTES